MSQLADIERTRRQHFAAPGGSFDRLIRFLRIALPSGVGALLAILAIAPVTEHNEFSFLLDKDEVDKAKERLKIDSALYRGEDNAGRPFSVRAGSAVQANSKVRVVEMGDLNAQFVVEDAPATLTAQKGAFDIDKEIVRVDGPMQFRSESGYDLIARNVAIAMNDKTITSFAPVEGKARFGLFRADRLNGNLDKRTVHMAGAVRGSGDFGTFNAAMLDADLATRNLLLSGGVSGTIKIGSYSANRVTVDDKARTIVLDGNARLRINGKAGR